MMSMAQMKFEKADRGSWVPQVDFGAEYGHQHIDDKEDQECDMADVRLNIPPTAYRYPKD